MTPMNDDNYTPPLPKADDASYSEAIFGIPEQDFIATFNLLSGKVHRTAREKGWWDQDRNNGEMLALIHSEVSEVLEALRHGNPPDDKIPEFSGAEAELADVIIRIMALNTAFFAPRYVLSRFQLLAGQPFYGGNSRTRKLIAKEYAKYLIGVGAVVALLAAAGDDDERGEIFGLKVPIELNPRSSDFLKPRFGNTRLDPLSGLLQVTTLIARVGSGEIKTSSGAIVPIRGDKVPFGTGDTSAVIGRFLRTKLSPALGTGVDLVTGKNVVGEVVTPKEAALRMMVPISVGEINETLQEQGLPKGTAMGLLSMFGIGLQTYPPKEPKASNSSPYSLKTDYSYKP